VNFRVVSAGRTQSVKFAAGGSLSGRAKRLESLGHVYAHGQGV